MIYLVFLRLSPEIFSQHVLIRISNVSVKTYKEGLDLCHKEAIKIISEEKHIIKQSKKQIVAPPWVFFLVPLAIAIQLQHPSAYPLIPVLPKLVRKIKDQKAAVILLKPYYPLMIMVLQP